MSFTSKVTGSLVYKDRVSNVKTAVRTFVDTGAVEAASNFAKGFGRNNRAFLRGIGIAR